ncbi:MAG: hypothetical protein ACFB10_02220 [Salibacteraceae bacterium]
MRSLILIGVFLGLLTSVDNLQAQDQDTTTTDSLFNDTILLMSGQQLVVDVIGYGKPLINYRVEKRNKIDIRQIDSYRVFCIRFGDGSEFIAYKHDPESDNYRTVEETRSFVYGQQDALNHFKRSFYALYGFAAGFYNGYDVGGVSGSILVVPFTPLPAIPVLLLGSIPKKAVRNPKYLNDPEYRDGFKRVIRGKRFLTTLKAATVGTLVGLATHNITN